MAYATGTPSVNAARLAAASVAARIDSVDVLRGLVMVVMALDHVRDYFTIARFDPVDLASTTPAYFVTRWITHFAAPVFLFLGGASAFMTGRRRTTANLSGFLLTRGLFLVALELVVVSFAWQFGMDLLVAQVIWAIGWSMVALAALVWLPRWAIGAAGVAMIALHNLTDGLDAVGRTGDALGNLWGVLHVPRTLVPLGPLPPLIAPYPLVPWIGVMAAGYAFGPVLVSDAGTRRRACLRLGLAMIAAFAILRATNLYGDPAPWSVQPTLAGTIMSFMNVTKYPPSLLFLLATLGPALAALPLLDSWRGRAAGFFTAFGRAPLFYYVVHLYVIHALAVAFGVMTGFAARDFLTVYFAFPDGYGVGLGVVYAVWIGVVFLLYAPTRWWGDLKARRKDLPWLSYL